VQVVEGQDQGLACGGIEQKGGNGVEQAEARLFRVRQEGRGLQVRQSLPEVGDEVGDVGHPGAHLGPHLVSISLADVRPG
jgi:hypothetical protein